MCILQPVVSHMIIVIQVQLDDMSIPVSMFAYCIGYSRGPSFLEVQGDRDQQRLHAGERHRYAAILLREQWLERLEKEKRAILVGHFSR